MFTSALYTCQVMHHRLAPKKHQFRYRIFMFWLDVDGLQAAADRSWMFSVRRPAPFRFRHTDHIKYPAGDPRNALSVREKLDQWLAEQGITEPPAKVFLLTHVRLFGYVFNPVSFYFCYDAQDRCRYVVTEVSNTFGEMKMFLVQHTEGNVFVQEDTKYFYVSPFTEMDDRFVFRYVVPDTGLQLRIDTLDAAGNRYFISTLTGRRQTLSDLRLLWYVVRFPLVTMRVMAGIHLQAFRLWLKRLPWHRKSDDADLQQDILNDVVGIPEKN